VTPRVPVPAAADAERSAWAFLALTLLLTSLTWGAAALSPQEWTDLPTISLCVVGGSVPSLVAIVMVWRRRSEAAFRGFLRRTIDPRSIPPVWYVVILGIAVVPNAVARLFPAGPASAGMDNTATFLPALLAVAILAGFAEEIGWRGFALDHLLVARSALVASLIVGFVWTVWHTPLYFIEGTIQHEAGLWSQDFWLDMSARIPLAILFTWVFINAGRSICSAILLHAVDNMGSVLISPEGNQLVVRLVITTALAVSVTVAWRVGRGGSGPGQARSASWSA
jgi:uncharacterized protein